MLKIEKFAKEQFGIELTKQQLEIIAIIAAGNNMPKLDLNDNIVANKATFAYLQDGLTEVKDEN